MLINRQVAQDGATGFTCAVKMQRNRPAARIGLIAALAVASCAEVAPISDSPARAALKARCAELIAFFDRYGVSRSENSDGPRNHTRIGAAIDCERGQYEKGIEAMEGLLRRKAFTVPPPGRQYEELEDL